jgi:hypothetical protein
MRKRKTGIEIAEKWKREAWKEAEKNLETLRGGLGSKSRFSGNSITIRFKVVFLEKFVYFIFLIYLSSLL